MPGALPTKGLQLFPPPPTKKQLGRQGSLRRNLVQTQSVSPAVQRAISPETLPTSPQAGRMASQPAADGRQSVLDGRVAATPQHRPTQPAGETIRSHTSLSEAPTLVRSTSSSSHDSTRKAPLAGPSSQGELSVMRSIFPQYNPDVPLEYQDYYPTQASPTHIPTTNISRAPYSPTHTANLRSPMSASSTTTHFPTRVTSAPAIPQPSTAGSLKELWKVTNGWRVSASEGRTFTLKMTSSADSPNHTLSSATAPFYNFLIEPTSTSGHLSITRDDPSKPPPPASGSSPSKNAALDVLTATLEETARRLPPNDGLIALLFPTSAKTMALDHATKPNAAEMLAAAEHELARLVWDADSACYYLVHPALTTPFVITIAHSPAWSRTEYALEHASLPRNVVGLVRDGGGGGWLEVDTGVAAKIDAFWIVDVAVAAVVLVALEEERGRNVERFEAPPVPPVLSEREERAEEKSRKKAAEVKIEEMELDLESQGSGSLRDELRKGKADLPLPARGLLGCAWGVLKCLWWVLKRSVKCVAAVIIGISNCLTRTPKT